MRISKRISTCSTGRGVACCARARCTAREIGQGRLGISFPQIMLSPQIGYFVSTDRPPDLDDFHRKLASPALQALQRSGQCWPLSVAGARCLLPGASVARCLMRAACSLLATCCPPLLPAAPQPGALLRRASFARYACARHLTARCPLFAQVASMPRCTA